MIPVLEIWKDVKGFEGQYQVSNLGEVKSLERRVLHKNGVTTAVREKILKECSNPKGYRLITLYTKNKRYSQQVHRLVMRTFVGESELEVNHKNGDKSDNRLSNLEYNTLRENMNHKNTILKNQKRYGVYWHKQAGKWASKIEVKRKQKHLGLFVNIEDAYEAFYIAYSIYHNIAPWSKL